MTVSKFQCSVSTFGLHPKKADATWELAGGHESPTLGTIQVRVHLGVLQCTVKCFVTSFSF